MIATTNPLKALSSKRKKNQKGVASRVPPHTSQQVKTVFGTSPFVINTFMPSDQEDAHQYEALE